MTYLFDVNKFNTTFQINEKNTKAKHNTGRRFRLFPYKTTVNVDQVTSLHELVGRYFCQLQESKEVTVTFDSLLAEIIPKVKVAPGLEDSFKKVLKDLFFDENGKLKPTNLNLLYLLHCPKEQIDVADFLSDVLGRRANVKEILAKCMKKMESQTNVLEHLVISLLRPETVEQKKHRHYFQVTEQFNELFESDLEFILKSASRTRESLVDLLHLYYFTQVAQTCLQLDSFLKGNRQQCQPIYFALEWERTSRGRKCYSQGWGALHESIKRMFTHAFVLELLNQTKEDHNVDYIALAQMISDPTEEKEMTEQVRLMCDTYRAGIDDCPEMQKLMRPNQGELGLAQEIKYLFDSVERQFEKTFRNRPQRIYNSGFLEFCKEQFVQVRGQAGSLLILSESNLILLAKLAIKDKEKLRLNDVFKEFEKRGFFLDSKSKVSAMQYFEKLNLIEKKSDSGDAQYVKRIL